MDDRLSPEQRREVAAIAQEKARATISRLRDRSEANPSKAGVNRRTALKITGVSGLLGLTALGSGSGIETASAGNHEDEDDDDEDEDADGGAGLKHLVAGQWNLRDPQYWRVNPPQPPKGVAGPSVVHDGVIYCFGGRRSGTGEEVAREISAYVIKHQGDKNKWTTALETPDHHLGGGSAAKKGDSVYVLGSEGLLKFEFPDDPMNDTGAWSEVNDEGSSNIAESRVAAANGEIYRFDKSPNEGETGHVRKLLGTDWSDPIDDGGWSGQSKYAAIGYNGDVYLIGDSESNDPRKATVYEPNGGGWSEEGINDLPFGTTSPSLTIRDDKLYVLGGTEPGTQVYDFNNDEWELYPGPHENAVSLPATGTDTGPGPWDGIYVFGGGDTGEMFRADVMGPID